MRWLVTVALVISVLALALPLNLFARWVLVHRARPLSEIAAAATELCDGHLDRRVLVPPHGPGTEVGQLTTNGILPRSGPPGRAPSTNARLRGGCPHELHIHELHIDVDTIGLARGYELFLIEVATRRRAREQPAAWRGDVNSAPKEGPAPNRPVDAVTRYWGMIRNCWFALPPSPH